MPQYLKKDENEGCYYIAQMFGYTLVNLGRRCVDDGSASLLKSFSENIKDKKTIYKTLLSSMILSSHYIEESKFYKDFIKHSHSYYDSLTPEQKKAYKDEEEDERAFPLFESYLEGALQVSTSIYMLPYLLEGRLLGYRVVETTWIVLEDGVLKEYPMMTRTLICFVDDNGDYEHIEPELGEHTLDSPPGDNSEPIDPTLSYRDKFRAAEKRAIDGAIKANVLTKL